jgi:CxxC motif-containing protein (DUF1111 family)
MRANLSYYLIGLFLILGPVGLRVLTWESPPAHQASVEDVNTGKELFTHEWKVNDPLCQGGDGLGPVYNATSCVACHKQGGIGGGGDNRHNVTTYLLENPNGQVKSGVLHAFASNANCLETLSRFSGVLPNTSRPSLEMVLATPRQNVSNNGVLHLSQRNTPALFGCKSIDEIPDRVIIAEERAQQLRWGLQDSNTEEFPVGRAFRLADGRIGKFGWKAQSASLGEFVQAACANELGLGNPRAEQPLPMFVPNYRTSGPDLTQKQCDQITAFCASLPQPLEIRDSEAEAGKKLFHKIGCAHCHAPAMGHVQGVYSDLLLHRMGMDLVASGSSYGGEAPMPPGAPKPDDDGSLPDEWRTPPLWGVADSAPYMHDGRAATLPDAIKGHGGQGAKSAQNFERLGPREQQQLLTFLQSLRAPATEQVARK